MTITMILEAGTARPDIALRIVNERLSDGSKAHNVAISYGDNDGQPILLPAVTLKDAITLIDKIQEAIEAHTVFICRVYDTVG